MFFSRHVLEAFSEVVSTRRPLSRPNGKRRWAQHGRDEPLSCVVVRSLEPLLARVEREESADSAWSVVETAELNDGDAEAYSQMTVAELRREALRASRPRN